MYEDIISNSQILMAPSSGHRGTFLCRMKKFTPFLPILPLSPIRQLCSSPSSLSALAKVRWLTRRVHASLHRQFLAPSSKSPPVLLEIGSPVSARRSFILEYTGNWPPELLAILVVSENNCVHKQNTAMLTAAAAIRAGPEIMEAFWANADNGPSFSSSLQSEKASKG